MLQQDIRTTIENAIIAAQADATLPDFEMPAVEVNRPKQADHGDYSTNVALVTAAAVKKATGEKANPRQISQAIVDHLDADGIIAQTDIAGPGFINFRLNHTYLHQQIKQILSTGDNYGRTDVGQGQRALVEYISANPTGPLTVGHGRNAVLGDTVANLLDWTGYEVTREYYFNNAGRQMRVLAQSLRARYEELLARPDTASQLKLDTAGKARLQAHVDAYTTKQLDLDDGETKVMPASFPDDGYLGEYIADIAQTMIDKHGSSLLDSDEIHLFQEAAESGIFKDIEKTMHRLKIEMDTYFNEHSLYENEKIWEVLDGLRQLGHIYDKDGAVWFKTTEFGKEKDTVLVKSTGEPVYRLPDMAYHVDKIERGFDKIIDIFGADHIAAYPDVMKAVELLGFDTSKIDVVIYQFVTIVRSGTPVKMSTRKANFVTLDELMDEVGEDVTRFFFLMRSPNTHLEFDLDLAKEAGEKNPVFYLQYAHARVCSILRRAEEQGMAFPKSVDLTLLTNESEDALMKELLRLPETIQYTAESKEPQVLVTYLNDVAMAFSHFYRDSHIVGEALPLAGARMHLAQAARHVLANGLAVLGISAPEKM